MVLMEGRHRKNNFLERHKHFDLQNTWTLLSQASLHWFDFFCDGDPCCILYLHRWLSAYNYHTDISPQVFIYAGAGVLMLTLLTVGFHSIKAAIANPENSLAFCRANYAPLPRTLRGKIL